MDDSLVIARCRAGDWEAFRYLVERYQAQAIRHALAILGNREDALDAVQQAFLDAYQALDRFDLERRFYPWFYTILRNHCFKLLGRERRRATESLEETEILAATSGLPPEQLIALEQALRALPAEEREIITLRHWDGLSYEELAERLAIPKGTVMSRLYYARQRLREKLTPRSSSGRKEK